MFSWASSRRSAGVVLGVQRLSSRTLFRKSQPSSSPSSSSPSSGCNKEYNHKGRSSGSSSKCGTFNLIQRSLSSAALILGSSIGYSCWSSSSSDRNPSVCFADAKEEAAWQIEDAEQVKSLFSSTIP